VKQSEKREYDRHPVAFPLEVHGRDVKGSSFIEKTRLKSISGSGAEFFAGENNNYFPGQSLKIFIALPGNDKVRACMYAEARVMRAETQHVSDHSTRVQEYRIAIQLETPLEFQRS
jgi:hypothetical protein